MIERLRQEDDGGWFSLEEGSGFILLESSTAVVSVASGFGGKRKRKKIDPDEKYLEGVERYDEIDDEEAVIVYITKRN